MFTSEERHLCTKSVRLYTDGDKTLMLRFHDGLSYECRSIDQRAGKVTFEIGYEGRSYGITMDTKFAERHFNPNPA